MLQDIQLCLRYIVLRLSFSRKKLLVSFFLIAVEKASISFLHLSLLHLSLNSFADMDAFTQYRLFLCSICCLTTAWLSLCAVHMILCKRCLIFSQGDLLERARRSSKKLKMRVVTMITITMGRCYLLNALQSAVFKNKPLTVSYAVVGKKKKKSCVSNKYELY